MFGHFLAGWPPGAVASFAIAAAGALLWPVKIAVVWLMRGPKTEQSHDLHRLIAEQRLADAAMIDHLRTLLDRGRRRENGWATGCELLLIAMPPPLTPEQLQLVTRARQLFETALIVSDGEGVGGP